MDIPDHHSKPQLPCTRIGHDASQLQTDLPNLRNSVVELRKSPYLQFSHPVVQLVQHQKVRACISYRAGNLRQAHLRRSSPRDHYPLPSLSARQYHTLYPSSSSGRSPSSPRTTAVMLYELIAMVSQPSPARPPPQLLLPITPPQPLSPLHRSRATSPLYYMLTSSPGPPNRPP